LWPVPAPLLPSLPRDGRPLALFDLDGTLLKGRTIMHLADRFGVRDEVQAVWDKARQQELAAGEEESRAIAALFAGLEHDEFTSACGEVPLRAEAADAVAALRKLDFRIGVVSASYLEAVDRVVDELGLDLGVGAQMLFENGKVTGRLAAQRFHGPCHQFVCKEAVMREVATRTDAPFTLAVGDATNDVCMFEEADLAVAINPLNERTRDAADVVVGSLTEIAPLAASRMAVGRR